MSEVTVHPRPCACYSGTIFVGHLVTEEDGTEGEVFEPYPCRRCQDKRGGVMFDVSYVRGEIFKILHGSWAAGAELTFYPLGLEDIFLVAAGLDPNDKQRFIVRVEEVDEEALEEAEDWAIFSSVED